MKRVAAVLVVTILAVSSIAAWIFFTTNFDAMGGKGWSIMAAARDRDDAFGYGFGSADLTAEVIADPVALANTYSALGLGDASAVDFQRELVIRAVAIGSGSCPQHLDDVELTEDRIVVRTSQGFSMACSGDAVPYSFVVRVDRNRLPEWPLKIVVGSDAAVREAVIGPWVRD